MENVTVELNPGELRIKMDKPLTGKFTLADLGLTDAELTVKGGNLRLVFEMGSLGDIHFFKMPTLEVSYVEKAHESGWVAEFNGEQILEKIDHSGHTTIMLLNRKKLDGLRHRHENNLILHGDFSEVVHLSAADTYFNLLEEPGT